MLGIGRLQLDAALTVLHPHKADPNALLDTNT